ncbi:GMC family oxidoreductase [Bdellovibrio sp. SKB1291214]|uniref:GMC family oxidoreductase N-terminal domain-containing protein n=1 Tax=Bdellovibrio sp. SKB1291214 TaxID=1732569 RepID=UPI000B517CB2|nr:GMC family oxidoreductase [Bdellovibrio sp. SKB1291214]UYL09071.1 GMC family oxidoreductase [Bdellovibrio sp. SKB1291214]
MDISRRGFLKTGIVGGLFSALASRSASAEPRVKYVPLKSSYRELTNPISDLREYYDVLVIGSGYGGSISAARLAGTCRLAVIERGPERPPGSFVEKFNQVRRDIRCARHPLGLFEIHANHEMDVLNGNGLGGTSLINAGAMVRPDRDTFRSPHWPAAIVEEVQSGAFEKYYSRVKQVLQGQAYNSERLQSAKVRAQEYAADKLGVNLIYPPIAVNLYGQQRQQQGVTQPRCIECGNCCSGCNTGAKNTLNMNYLPLAKNQGAEIYTQMEVLWIEKLDRGYKVHCLYVSKNGERVRKSIIAGKVILSAGTMGSSRVLLVSQEQGLSLSGQLGKRFSGNGDVLGLSFNTAYRTNAIGFSSASKIRVDMKPGAVIYSIADYRNRKNLFDRFIIEEGTFPGAFAIPLRLAMGVAKWKISAARYLRVARDIVLSKDIEKGALNYSMVYLGMGHDRADGKLKLDRKGRIRVIWPEVKSDPIYPTIDRAMKRQSEALGGNFVMNPRTLLINGKNLVTVHPLGGCVMADSVKDGVVNQWGQVYQADGTLHEGLYVLDGSIVPTALGVNPLLTISALAERAVERIRNQI